MKILRDLGARPSWQAASIAIGNFDGVHLGHCALLTRARQRAEALGGPVLAVTFDPHPSTVLAPHLAPPLLTTVQRRLELLAGNGVDIAVVLQFSAALAAMPAERFVEDVLRRELAAAHVVVGHDFSYGQGRGGSTSTLLAHGARGGFGVDVLAAVQVDGEIASSTRIRGHLRSGNLARARALLGHGYDVDGVVVHGAKRGRELGFPTANVAPELELIAASGVYAVRLALLGESGAPGPFLPAVASLGTNPTFVTGGARTFEVFVLDFSGDLYDRRVRVELVHKLRDEARFASIDALIAQMRADVAEARALLSAGP
jgi:riboflavin kinase / FMN adenylyltransferase